MLSVYIMYRYMYYVFFVVFFFKQKTAYEMRISDWSSDVCSSDLYYINPSVVPYDVCEIIMNLNTFNEMPPDLQEVMLSASRVQNLDLSAQIGRASCRERVCQYV